MFLTRVSPVTFPSPPWRLQGDLWLSLFPVRSGGTTDRPAGLYGVGFADYKERSVLRYRELLVARLVRHGAVPRVNVTDMWVNSSASREGGRSLWGMPKELAELHVTDRRLGPTVRTSCDANITGAPIAAARFMAVDSPTVRMPLRFTTSQHRPNGGPVVTQVSGSAKALPCLGKWDFGARGPLAWLHGRHPVMTFRFRDFRVLFGG